MEDVYERFGMTVRTYHKILKVARTIADLCGCANINKNHLMEAIAYSKF